MSQKEVLENIRQAYLKVMENHKQIDTCIISKLDPDLIAMLHSFSMKFVASRYSPGPYSPSPYSPNGSARLSIRNQLDECISLDRHAQ